MINSKILNFEFFFKKVKIMENIKRKFIEKWENIETVNGFNINKTGEKIEIIEIDEDSVVIKRNMFYKESIFEEYVINKDNSNSDSTEDKSIPQKEPITLTAIKMINIEKWYFSKVEFNNLTKSRNRNFLEKYVSSNNAKNYIRVKIPKNISAKLFSVQRHKEHTKLINTDVLNNGKFLKMLQKDDRNFVIKKVLDYVITHDLNIIPIEIHQK